MLAMSPGNADHYRDRFALALPYPHVVVDGFFLGEFACKLLQEFPGSATAPPIPLLREAGPACRQLDAFFASSQTLEWLSRVAGVADLRYEPDSVGARFEEAFQGQRLSPYAGFDLHPRTRDRCCLRLVVFLNDEWDARWGGSLRLSPRARYCDNVPTRSYLPRPNRGVLFEMGAGAHGFDSITLPPGHEAVSRKMIAVYFYTGCPETAAHETRDKRRLEEAASVLIANASAEETLPREDVGTVPLRGGVRHAAEPRGVYPDACVSREVALSIESTSDINGFTVRGWAAPGMPEGSRVTVYAGATAVGEATVAAERWFEVTCPLVAPTGSTTGIRVCFSQCVIPAMIGPSLDTRALSAIDLSLDFTAPECASS